MNTQYKSVVKKYSELQDCIEIPKFQRGLVWGDSKKKRFIKTLKEGLPIGVLLLSEKTDGKYLVIDGLQRFTTMKDYSNNFFKYIEGEEISDTDIMSIIIASNTSRTIFDQYIDSAKSDIKNQIRECVKTKIQEGQGKNHNKISWEVTNELVKSISIINKEDEIEVQGAVYSIVERIYKEASIDDIPIPVLIFTGSSNKLADIYQSLNQEGVKLSKYDVFAATWNEHYVQIKDDDEFIDLIIKKYEDSEEQSQLEIANFDADEMRETGKLTVFEYAFGIGKALKKECPLLFPGTENESKIDSIGFLLLTELTGLTYQTMDNLAVKMLSYDNLDCKLLKEKIIESARAIENTLNSVIIAPTKKKKQTSLACHSELQLASFIVVLFKLKYVITQDEGIQYLSSNNKEVKAFKEFLKKHYLYDILDDYWSGSGDSKLEEIIKDPETCRYVKDINRDDFEQVISKWLTRMNEIKPLKSVSAEVKLFLNYLLRANVPALEIDGTEYDVEHCTPKKIIQKYFLKKGKEVPLSPACNLVYIPKYDNRYKGEYTYYQMRNAASSVFTLKDDFLEKLVYPRKEELSFVESQSTLTVENYETFLSNRVAIVTNALLSKLYNC